MRLLCQRLPGGSRGVPARETGAADAHLGTIDRLHPRAAGIGGIWRDSGRSPDPDR